MVAGPLDRRFGVQDYCEAARLLRSKSGNYRCLVAGPEVSGSNAFGVAQLKRYRDVVQYLGPQADPRPFIARTHAFVLPAFGDAVPGPLIEAMAMGRPVITTTARGCRGAVSGGTNGMLVPAGDPIALASAMARLLLRPTSFRRWRARAGLRRKPLRQPADQCSTARCPAADLAA